MIVPVILSDNASAENLFESSDFKFVFSVLRALGANDERIIEEFRELSRGTRSRGEIIQFDFDVVLPVGVDADQFIKSVELRCWEKLAKLAYRPFAEAREFARSLHLNSSGEWHEYALGKRTNLPQLPKDIPRWPKYNYRAKGWTDWADFLGYSPDGANPVFRPYHEARAFARALKLKTSTEWRKFTDGKMPEKGFLPSDVPKYPPHHYPDDWQNWANFLGIPPKPKLDPIVPYEEARAFARSLRLKNGAEWKRYYRGEIPGKLLLPSNVPRHVFQAYRHTGWINWEDFLGVRIPGTRIGKKEGWREFEEARDFARSLGLKGQVDWKRYCRDQPTDKPVRPADIPTTPRKNGRGSRLEGLR